MRDLIKKYDETIDSKFNFIASEDIEIEDDMFELIDDTNITIQVHTGFIYHTQYIVNRFVEDKDDYDLSYQEHHKDFKSLKEAKIYCINLNKERK